MPMNSGRGRRFLASCSLEGKAVEAASLQPNRDSIATYSLQVPTLQPLSPTVSQSWLPSHKRNLATFIADGLHPLPRSRPTLEDPSPHPFLSSSSSPSIASSTEPSRYGNRASNGDKNATTTAPLVVSRCNCDSDMGFCVEIRSRICLISKFKDISRC